MNTENDVIIRGITSNGYIKIIAVNSRNTVSRAMEIHRLTPVTAAALGRTLTAASMLGSELKKEGGSLTIQINGNGPIGKIVAVSDNVGNTRGYCQRPAVELPLRQDKKLDVSGVVGNTGYLTVVKDLGLKEPYVGQIELKSGEIAEDITAYLAESEQIPSVCALGVLVSSDLSIKSAGGYILQLMPNAPEETITKLEKTIENAPPVTKLLSANASPSVMIKEVLKGFDTGHLSETLIDYKCFCSKERVERTLLSLGRRDIDEIIKDDKGAEITCRFCDNVYTFTTKEIKKLTESR